ncbi:hypothetical protein, partial [Paracoccus versutus]|uniref:hypothetical protein n=1 Tax=Paracoccus versutus TaxID=34007 RepID=UPI001AD84452
FGIVFGRHENGGKLFGHGNGDHSGMRRGEAAKGQLSKLNSSVFATFEPGWQPGTNYRQGGMLSGCIKAAL